MKKILLLAVLFGLVLNLTAQDRIKTEYLTVEDGFTYKDVSFDDWLSDSTANSYYLPYNWKYTFSSNTTDSRPGGGYYKLNNATLANVTEVYIDSLDSDGVDKSNNLGVAVNGSILSIQVDDNNYAIYQITDKTANTNYYTYDVTYLIHNGVLSGLNTLNLDINNTFSFSNGLTETSGAVALGGTLTGNIVFENQDFYSVLFNSIYNDNFFIIDDDYFNNYYQSGNLNTSINMDYNNYELTMRDDVTGYSVYNPCEISATEADQIISVNDGVGDVLQLQLNTDNGAIFTDEIYGKGLMYPADYSATFGDSSLITKKYADDSYLSPLVKSDSITTSYLIADSVSIPYYLARNYVNGAGIVLTISASATYYTIKPCVTDTSMNVTATDSSFTIQKSGFYFITMHSSGKCSANGRSPHISLFVNNVEDSSFESKTRHATSGELYGINWGGTRYFNQGDILKAKIKYAANTGTYTFEHFGFDIHRLH